MKLSFSNSLGVKHNNCQDRINVFGNFPLHLFSINLIVEFYYIEILNEI